MLIYTILFSLNGLKNDGSLGSKTNHIGRIQRKMFVLDDVIEEQNDKVNNRGKKKNTPT